jgi:MerR family regulatory protein
VNATAVQEQTFTIAEVVAKTGVSAHTLRYYERIGLIDVGRQANGHRCFTEYDIHGVVFIGKSGTSALRSRPGNGDVRQTYDKLSASTPRWGV